MTPTQQPSLLEWSAVSAGSQDGVQVAHVLVDAGLAHLDHTFDYEIPVALDEQIRPGVRVKVRFAGTERDGFVISRATGTAHAGKLAPVRRVVDQLPVLTTEVHGCARAIAARYAGTTMDVLRLAVPPRHAGAEKSVLSQPAPEQETAAGTSRPEEPSSNDSAAGSQVGSKAAAKTVSEAGSQAGSESPEPPAPTEEDLQEWSAYPGGAAFLRRLAAADHPRAAWCALPHVPASTAEKRTTETSAAGQSAGSSTPAITTPHWARAITAAVLATRAAGRSAVVCLPDQRDIDLLEAAMRARGLRPAVLTAEQGRSARYRRFLLTLTGRTQVVIGSRSAALAPVSDLGLVVCWDDGDDLHHEPRAPYPHVREMLTLRAHEQGAAALIGGFIRTPRAQLLVRQGWARSLTATRDTVRAVAPRIHAPSAVDLQRDGGAGQDRIPTRAIQLLRRRLEHGPVLVQVPRAGYIPLVACQDCRTPARCTHCHGPLALTGARQRPRCSWCGRDQAGWRCPECQGTAIRAVRVGSSRTAEELGRAFPGVRVRTSSTDVGVIDRVEDRPQLVIATPGAEPPAEGGYSAALLLDAGVISSRPELSAAVEALRRWMRAAALVRPQQEVLVLGHGAPVPVQALVRWHPSGFAERELAERAELQFPPVAAMASLSGDLAAVRAGLHQVSLPKTAEILGPVPHGPDQAGQPQARALIRLPGEQLADLTRALKHLQALRSAHKEPGSLRIQVDPDQLA